MSDEAKATPPLTLEELSKRIDGLEQELEWTRYMLDNVREQIEDMNSLRNNYE